MNRQLHLLTPRPKHAAQTDERLDLSGGLCPNGDLDSAQIQAMLARFDSGASVGPAPLYLKRVPSAHPESYALAVRSEGVFIEAAGSVGACHGLRTLLQWRQLHRAEDGVAVVPGLRVEDRPDVAVRGVLLDVSRDKVPTMATLFQMIDLLADLKINQLQLYTEHTFAYAGHDVVWRDADPLTPAQIGALVAACRLRHIDLVPNQNSFGHFHRWLVHEPYRELAEVPAGVVHPFSKRLEPFSLCAVDARVPSFLAGLYDQLLPHFDGDLFNVGLDETFDLGQGRSKARCEALGKTPVYLEFLERVHGLAASRGRRIQFWGDIIIQQPELIPRLPKDAIALEWGYEADHPFEAHAQCFAASGLDFYICPGTGSWNSIGGRTANTLANLKAAARAAVAHGASGILITDWGDFGHLQPYPIALPGFLAGAAAAWRADDSDLDAGGVARRLGRLVLGDEALGAALTALGAAADDAACQPKNGTAPFFLLRFAEEGLTHERLAGLTPADLEAISARASAAVSRLGAAKTQEGGLMRAELNWAADAVQWLCGLGLARFDAGLTAGISQIPGPLRAKLLQELHGLVDAYRNIWLKRNRTGGLDDSISKLTGPAKALG